MSARLLDVLKENFGKTLLATGVGSAMLSAIATDVSGWRASNREFMKHQFEVSEQTDRELLPLIRKFSEKALGKGQTNEADLTDLKTRVDNSYLVATRIVERLPNANPDFRPYVASLIELQKCAETFHTAADAHCWVDSVSRYAASKKAFEQKVTALQTSWP